MHWVKEYFSVSSCKSGGRKGSGKENKQACTPQVDTISRELEHVSTLLATLSTPEAKFLGQLFTWIPKKLGVHSKGAQGVFRVLNKLNFACF